MNQLPAYILSFTGASLELSQSVKIAEAYLQFRDWDSVKERVKTDNLLQARTQSSIQRIYQELFPRLSELTDVQLDLLVNGNHEEQKHILWYAICKRYAYIREFAVEVIHEKFLRFDHKLTDFDYDAFFNRKADWHPELDQITETTRVKIRTQTIRMLREAGLLSGNNQIIPVSLSSRVLDVLTADSVTALRIFPATVSAT